MRSPMRNHYVLEAALRSFIDKVLLPIPIPSQECCSCCPPLPASRALRSALAALRGTAPSTAMSLLKAEATATGLDNYFSPRRPPGHRGVVTEPSHFLASNLLSSAATYASSMLCNSCAVIECSLANPSTGGCPPEEAEALAASGCHSAPRFARASYSKWCPRWAGGASSRSGRAVQQGQSRPARLRVVLPGGPRPPLWTTST